MMPDGQKQMSKGRIGRYGYKNASSFVVNIVSDEYREAYDNINWGSDVKEEGNCSCEKSGEGSCEGCEDCSCGKKVKEESSR